MGTCQSNNANYLCNLSLGVIAQVIDRFRLEGKGQFDVTVNRSWKL